MRSTSKKEKIYSNPLKARDLSLTTNYRRENNLDIFVSDPVLIYPPQKKLLFLNIQTHSKTKPSQSFKYLPSPRPHENKLVNLFDFLKN